MALDLETTGLNPLQDHVLLVGIDEWAFAGRYLTRLGELVANPKIIKHIFNAAFDGMFFQKAGIVPKRVVDPMIGAMLLKAGLYSPEGTFTLGNLLKQCLGIDHDKSLQSSFIGADPRSFAPSKDQLRYLRRDTASLANLSRWVGTRLAAQGMSDVWRLENSFTQVIAEMQLHGAPVDLKTFVPSIEGWEADRAKAEIVLAEALTPPIMQVRMRNFQKLDHEKAEWERQYAEATSYIEASSDVQAFESKGARREWIRDQQRKYQDEHPRPDSSKLRYARQVLQQPITLTSHTQLRDALQELGVQIKDTKRATLARVKLVSPQEIHPVIDKLAEFSKLEKLTSTYGRNILDRLDDDHRLRSRYQQIKATGRISSGRDEDDNGFNLQNPHPEFRKHIIAPEGRTFVILDYGQIELRIAAELVLRRDPNAKDALVEAFLHGKDPHQVFADRVGIERKPAKVGNFSVMYGIGPEPMALRMHADMKSEEPFGQKFIDLAKQVQRAFWDENPTLRRVLREYEYQGLDKGFTVTLGGRKRFYDKVEKGTPEWHVRQGSIRRAAANHPIQGLSADIMKLAAVLVQPSLEGNTFLWNLVHDEVCVECDEEDAPAVGLLVKMRAQTAYETFIKHVPYQGDCKVTKTWQKE